MSNLTVLHAVVRTATKIGFDFLFQGRTVMPFRYDEILFKDYPSYTVPRLYKGEEITVTIHPDGGKPIVTVVSLEAYFNVVDEITAMFDVKLTLASAEDLYGRYQHLDVVFKALQDSRKTPIGKHKSTVVARCKKILGLTPSKLGDMNRYRYDITKPKAAIHFAYKYIKDRIPRLGWILVLRSTKDLLNHILNNRSDELDELLEQQIRQAILDIDARIAEIAENGFDYDQKHVQNAPIPFPEEILEVGDSRVATCVGWSGEWDGRVEWTEADGETKIRCRVKAYMIFAPRGRSIDKRRLFRGERIQITLMTRQALAEKYFGGNVEGNPDDVMTEITFVDVVAYLDFNQQIQRFIEREDLTPSEEELLDTLLDESDVLYEAILPQRRKSLRFKDWHNGIQKAGMVALGQTRSLYKTLELTPYSPYGKIWGRFRTFYGKKGNHLNKGNREELRHIRHIVIEKITRVVTIEEEQLKHDLQQIVDQINSWLEPFES